MKVTKLSVLCVILGILIFISNSSAKIDPTSIAGMWLFEEGKGNEARDSSGNENNGTLANNPKWTDGKFGNAIVFDGASTYVDCGNGENLDITEAITFMAWVKFNALDFKGAGGNLFSIGAKGYPDSVAAHAGWWFSYDNRNNGQSFPYTCFGNKNGGWAGGGNSFGGYNFVFDKGEWYHLAFTIEKSTAKLYINGEQSGADKTLANLILSDTSRNLVIGCADKMWYFNGVIDEVAIFSVSLEEQDIQAIMNNGLQRSTVFAVDPNDKSAITWGKIKD